MSSEPAHTWLTVGLAALMGIGGLRASDRFDQLAVPALTINGQVARAHTQGLEVVDGVYYVTARREDVSPRRALLLRISPGQWAWDVWDITPVARPGDVSVLDHPGGLQSDGRRLWIPVSESRRGGRTVVRAFAISRLRPGTLAVAEREFEVADHVGAIAVDRKRRRLLGASWDTETVSEWDRKGRLQRQWRGSDLAARWLGPSAVSGLAVQDWKIVGDRLYAFGLAKADGTNRPTSRSQALVLPADFNARTPPRELPLPPAQEIEWCREGAAVSAGSFHLLPADLGPATQLFRFPLSEPVLRLRGVLR